MPENQYYLVVANQRRGPFAPSDLVAQGLTPDSLVWYQGLANWLPARQVPELAPLLQAMPPPVPQPAAPAPLMAGPLPAPGAWPAGTPLTGAGGTKAVPWHWILPLAGGGVVFVVGLIFLIIALTRDSSSGKGKKKGSDFTNSDSSSGRGKKKVPDSSDSDSSDAEQLQGRWKVVRGEERGKKVSDKELEGQYAVFDGARFTLERKGEKKHSKYKIDPRKKEIDFIDRSGKGEIIKGIYELNGDSLKICVVQGKNKPRPAEFRTRRNDQQLLMVMEREGK
jgi:uncharacterized protein (TIGR03067 family)